MLKTCFTHKIKHFDYRLAFFLYFVFQFEKLFFILQMNQ